MDIKEIMALAVLVFVTMLTISIMWKFKRMRDQRKEMDQKFNSLQEKLSKRFKDIDEDKARQKMREHPNYSNARFDPKNPDVLLPTKREVAKKYATQTQSVGNNSVGVQSNNDTDWLTPALIFATMNSSSGRVSAKVDDDTGSVTFREEPKQEPSYSSSYSSSNDDDDRKSSYSSSYSSSSSDDSYSSSSSDSSYSSSFSSD